MKTRLAVLLLVLVVAAGGFAAGRGTAPEPKPAARATAQQLLAVRSLSARLTMSVQHDARDGSLLCLASNQLKPIRGVPGGHVRQEELGYSVNYRKPCFGIPAEGLSIGPDRTAGLADVTVRKGRGCPNPIPGTLRTCGGGLVVDTILRKLPTACPGHETSCAIEGGYSTAAVGASKTTLP